MLKTHLVCIELELSSQDGTSDVVHEIRSTHLATTASRIDPKTAIGIIWVPNRICCRVDDACEMGEVLNCGCNGSRSDRGEE